MELENLTRILEQVRKNSTTSQSSAAYKCSECSDTGWIPSRNNCYKQCHCISMTVIKSCWVNYGVKPEDVKPLKAYIPYNKFTETAKAKAVNYVTSFNSIAHEENNWFGVFGQAGSGKSHLTISMGATLLTRKLSPLKVVYMPYLEIMRELKANSMDDEYYINLLSRYKRAEVLIIDDLFKDKVKNGKLAFDLTEADMKHIYPIINFRYSNKMPTIVSSECTPNMLLDLDRALCGRILERCNDNITVFVGTEYDYRMRRFERGKE